MGSIGDLYEAVKRSEKKALIRSSGSTRDGGMEKIRSGQSYLYKLRGMESEVIELRMVEKVSGSFLNQALNLANRRYPYFNTRLLELDGDFYIVQNPNSMVARRTRELARLGDISCGHHLVDITYYDHSICFSFHHALCDGRGIKPYIETVFYYYVNLRYHVTVVPDGVRLAGEGLLPGETDDPFAAKYTYDESREFDMPSRDGFTLPESGTADGDWRFELKVPREAFMAACRECGATPVILLTLLMSRGIAELYPDWDMPINAHIASDMRAELDMPNTYKNCVRTLTLPYTRDMAAEPLREQASRLRSLMTQLRGRDLVRRDANSFIGLSDRLDDRGSYESKREIMGFFEGMALSTYTVSYLGQFSFGDGARYLEEMHLYNSGTQGLGINMICAGDYFTLDFKQSFASGKYAGAFAGGLKALGLPFQLSGCIPFSTPRDALIKR